MSIKNAMSIKIKFTEYLRKNKTHLLIEALLLYAFVRSRLKTGFKLKNVTIIVMNYVM